MISNNVFDFDASKLNPCKCGSNLVAQYFCIRDTYCNNSPYYCVECSENGVHDHRLQQVHKICIQLANQAQQIYDQIEKFGENIRDQYIPVQEIMEFCQTVVEENDLRKKNGTEFTNYKTNFQLVDQILERALYLKRLIEECAGEYQVLEIKQYSRELNDLQIKIRDTKIGKDIDIDFIYKEYKCVFSGNIDNIDKYLENPDIVVFYQKMRVRALEDHKIKSKEKIKKLQQKVDEHELRLIKLEQLLEQRDQNTQQYIQQKVQNSEYYGIANKNAQKDNLDEHYTRGKPGYNQPEENYDQ